MTGISVGRLLTATGFAVAFSASFAVAAPADAVVRGLAAHRAVYEMSLARRADRADVIDVGGRLVYEFTGSVCDGFSSRFRLVTQLTNTDGTARITDLRTASHEDGDGRTFDFVNRSLVDSRTVEDTKGAARHDGPSTRVSIAGAPAKTVELPATVRFPTEHMVEIIEAAEAGRSVAQIDLFDGSDGGGRVFRTTVVIGRELKGPDDAGDESKAAVSALTDGKRRWPVEISYFDPTKGDVDATPEYQLGFVLYENGISRKLRLDYGDFALAGRLSSLEALPVSHCGPE